MHTASQLSEALSLPIPQRLSRLLELCAEHDATGSSGDLVSALSGLIAEVSFSSRERMLLGEALGKLGDPRLRLPSQPDYWVDIKLDEEDTVSVGRYMVTNAEWVNFISSGGYNNDDFWSEEGQAWRDSERPSWQELASDPESAPLIIPNQPVVGVSWFEAMAYANANGARLLEFDERVRIMRGVEKRPYPWGAPFGQGNANTVPDVAGKKID